VERALDQARERAERRRAEAALIDSERSSRLAIEAARLGVWDYDPRAGLMSWDDRCRQMLGVEADSALSYDELFLRACHPDDRARLEAAMAAAVTSDPEGDGGFAEEFRTLLPHGQVRWLAARGQAVFEGAACTRFVGVLRDITDETRAREDMRRFAERLEHEVAARTAERDRIWRLSRDLFAVLDLQGLLVRANPAWETTLGHDPEQVGGRSLALLAHPDDRAELERANAQLRAGQVVERFEMRLAHADGSWRWISWTAAAEAEAVYATGRDVTAEREAAATLAATNSQLLAQIEERERVEATLQQMQRLEAVGQLTSGVAHDFNNLLTVVLGNIGFVEKQLAKRGAEGDILARIGHMRTAAERGAKLTAQMLAFSRRQRLEPKPVDLNETVSGMRDLLQSTMGGSVRLETVLKPGLWPALVDPTQIELIILNLAINARDAMEVGGGLTVETANVVLSNAPQRPEEPAPGEYVELSVSDTGPGMSPEVLARAFEPFFTTKEIGKGSGLGLAQVYGFAKQSGGGVRIVTRPGEGVSVKVYLPRAASLEVEAPAPAPVRLAAGGSRTVLVVDDDSAVREVTASMLQDLGYLVIEAGSGRAALDLLSSEEPVDLLLADYAMPGMNGAETARAARELRPELPIVFITGYADLSALRDVGEERIVQKPFRDDELGRKLEAALGQAAEGHKVVPFRRA
jgi:PAS domain S-box-containing protein